MQPPHKTLAEQGTFSKHICLQWSWAAALQRIFLIVSLSTNTTPQQDLLPPAGKQTPADDLTLAPNTNPPLLARCLKRCSPPHPPHAASGECAPALEAPETRMRSGAAAARLRCMPRLRPHLAASVRVSPPFRLFSEALFCILCKTSS